MIAGGRFQLTTALIASGINVECQSQNPPDFVVAKALTGWGEKTMRKLSNGGGKDP